MQQSLLVSLLILCNLDQRRLSTLPHTLDQDRQLCEQAGVDAIFAPTAEEMGLGRGAGKVCDSYSLLPTPVLRLSPFAMTSVLWCSRPGHFQELLQCDKAIEPGTA